MTILKEKITARWIAMTAMLGAVATVLMMLDPSVPFMPSFIKFDISELPALVASFSMGPISGVAVCLIKNVINVFSTTTAGVGELSNFLLGACFVFPAGLIYAKKRSFSGALIGALVGNLVMAILCFPINYYITYPFYERFMPREMIISAYQAILPWVDNLAECLLIFNVPFTFGKGLVVCIITFLIYKRISPIIKGRK